MLATPITRQMEAAFRIGSPYPTATGFALNRGLFAIRADRREEVSEAFFSLDDERRLLFNDAILSTQGMGDDHFFLCEVLSDQTLLDYETIQDDDYHDY